MKPRKKIAIVTLFILILVGFGFWLWPSRVDTKIIGKDASLRRVVFSSEKTEKAYLSLPYTADSQQYAYVNVLVDLNKDGKLAPYQSGGKTQEEWVTQNINTRVFADEGANVDFKLTDLTAENRQDFSVRVLLTKQQLNNWGGKKIRDSAFQTLTIQSIEQDDISLIYTPHPDRDGGVAGYFSVGIAHAQDEPIPNRPPVDESSNDKEGTEATINLDVTNPQPSAPKKEEKTIETLSKEFNVFHSDVPDISQGKNECAIMSTANSLLWLAKKNSFTEKMPKSQGELISELKTDLQWDKDGVDTKKNYLAGKKAFTDRHKIPLESHLVNQNEYDLNIVAKIALELKKGQDVEVSLAYWEKKADGTWKKTGGHMVTAVGATGTRDGQTLDIHDPLSPGPSKLDIYKIDGTRVIDYKYEGDQVTYIRAAIAESPITPPVTPPDDNSTPTAPTPKVPTFDTKYQKYVTDNVTQFSVVVKPLDLAGTTITGMDIDLAARGYTLPPVYATSVNLNEAGWYKADWQCNTVGNVLRCLGKDALREGTYSVVGLNFSASVDTPPPFLNVKLLGPDESTVVGVGVEFKPE